MNAMRVTLWLLAIVSGFLSLAKAEPPKRPFFERITLVSFSIETLPFNGASPRRNEEAFLKRLSKEATQQAKRELLKKNMAKEVLIASKSEATMERPTITGVVRMPISLPTDINGSKAASRHGRFAFATVTLHDTTGKVLASETVELTWRDANWTWGTGRSRRNRSLDEILAHYAHEAAGRCILRLEKTLASQEPKH